jgi:hypothetical protein
MRRHALNYSLLSILNVLIMAWVDCPAILLGADPKTDLVEGQPVKGLKDFMDQIINLKRKQRVIMLGLDHRTGQTGFVQVVMP